MAVKLRLRRGGRKQSPYYTIIAADERAPRDGRFLEILGTYDPRAEPSVAKLDDEKALKWLIRGAQPSETVRSILSREGLMLKLHLWRKGKSDEEIEEAYQAWKQERDKKLADAESLRVKAREDEKAKRMEAERKKRQEIQERVNRKKAEAQQAAAETVAESSEEGGEEATAAASEGGEGEANPEATQE
jgi:small subunit ribosomal protein S16